MHNQKDIPLNQTQFSFEEPIFEDPTIYQEEKPIEEKPIENKSKKKLYLIIGGVVSVFVILILLLVIIMKMRGDSPMDNPLRRDPTDPKELSPLEQRIEESRVLLDEADPTKQDLSYPPINFEIRLDPKED